MSVMYFKLKAIGRIYKLTQYFSNILTKYSLGMATHSIILSWRIPCTEEPGRLQSIGSQTVEHSWSHWACMHAPRILLHVSQYFHSL